MNDDPSKAGTSESLDGSSDDDDRDDLFFVATGSNVLSPKQISDREAPTTTIVTTVLQQPRKEGRG